MVTAEIASAGSYRAVGVSHRYAPRAPLVLDGVYLEVCRGTIHGVLGHNGAGKSTLLGILAGRIRPSSGHVEQDGKVLVNLTPRAALERGVVAVYQELSLVPSLSVAENILVGRPDRGACRRSSGRRTRVLREAAERVGIPRANLGRLVGELKFGERQQVEIARALARKSRYLLLDEPTAGLNDAEVTLLFSVLRDLAGSAEPVGVLMINHHADQVLDLCDRYTVLRDGKVVLAERVGARSAGEVVTAIVGDSASAATERGRNGRVQTRTGVPTGTTALRVERLVAAGVSCDTLVVPGGSVHGLYGLEGAGQQALLATLCGETRVRAGTASLGDVQLGRGGPAQARRSGVLLLSGDRTRMILPQMRVLDNVALARVASQGLRAPLLHRRRLERAAHEALAAMDVRGDLRSPMVALSGGNQQKAIMARALVAEYRLLLLLEPTVGVDLGARKRIIEAVRSIALGRQVPVLIASSDEDDLLDCCDTITVFRAGEVVGTFAVGAETNRSSLRRLALHRTTSSVAEPGEAPTAVGQGSSHA
jgi:ABC-type sugar transport system ATPase subunit